MKRTNETAPTLVFNVPSVEEHLRKSEKAGGKVVYPPQQVGDFGIYARFKDPEGNIMGLWRDMKK